MRLLVTFDEDRDRLAPLADGRWILLKNLYSGREDEDDPAVEDESLQIICLQVPAE